MSSQEEKLSIIEEELTVIFKDQKEENPRATLEAGRALLDMYDDLLTIKDREFTERSYRRLMKDMVNEYDTRLMAIYESI